MCRTTLVPWIQAALEKMLRTVLSFLSLPLSLFRRMKKNRLRDAALRRAGKEGRVEIVRTLLNRGAANVDSWDENGLTLLHLASRENHVGLVRTLLEHGANPNLPDCQGDGGSTALMYAGAAGNWEICSLLLEWQAGVDILNRAGATALHAASSAGHASVVRLLLEKGEAMTSICNSKGLTPLDCAIVQGHVEVTRLLLQQLQEEDDENVSGGSSWSALDNNCIQAVVSGDATEQHSPLEAACYHGHTEIVQLLLVYLQEHAIRISQAQLNKALYLAASHGGCEKTVGWLLERGANVHGSHPCHASNQFETKTSRTTVLHAACRNGHAEVVGLLLKKGADPRRIQEAPDGGTALHSAAAGNHANVVRLLLDHHQQQHHHDEAAATATTCHDSIINIINARDCLGRTALHRAALLGHANVVQVLLQRGADSQIRDLLGHVALALACRAGPPGHDNDAGAACNDNVGAEEHHGSRRLDTIYSFFREEPHSAAQHLLLPSR